MADRRLHTSDSIDPEELKEAIKECGERFYDKALRAAEEFKNREEIKRWKNQ